MYILKHPLWHCICIYCSFFYCLLSEMPINVALSTFELWPNSQCNWNVDRLGGPWRPVWKKKLLYTIAPNFLQLHFWEWKEPFLVPYRTCHWMFLQSSDFQTVSRSICGPQCGDKSVARNQFVFPQLPRPKHSCVICMAFIPTTRIKVT